MPNTIVNLNEYDINDSIEIILTKWPNIIDFNDNILKKEALLWKQRWIDTNEKPRNFIDALNLCDKSIFPNIFNILKTDATLPITIATKERSFSTLKRIKTYLRNSAGENRLNGSALLSIYREIR